MRGFHSLLLVNHSRPSLPLDSLEKNLSYCWRFRSKLRGNCLQGIWEPHAAWCSAWAPELLRSGRTLLPLTVRCCDHRCCSRAGDGHPWAFSFAEYRPRWVVFCWWKCCTLLVRFLWQQQHTTLASQSRLTISKQGIQPWRHVCIWFISHISLFCTHSYLFWSNFHEYFKYFKILDKWVTCAFTFWHIFEGSCENEYSSEFGSEVSLRKKLIYIYTHTPQYIYIYIYTHTPHLSFLHLLMDT